MYGLPGNLVRILRGERLRKATPQEVQYLSGDLFRVPVSFVLVFVFLKHHGHFLDSACPVALWIAGSSIFSVLVFVGCFRGRHMPAKVSHMLAAVARPVLFVLVLTGHIGP